MSLVRNASTALFGIGSYAIYQILLLSLISKYYGTETLGIYAFYFSLTVITFFFTSLGFRQLIVTSSKFTEFTQYLRLRVILSFSSVLFILFTAILIKNESIILCLLISSIRFMESLSEISYSHFQKIEKHNFQSKLLFGKSLLSISLLFFCIFGGFTLVHFLCAVLLMHFLILFFYEYNTLRKKQYDLRLKLIFMFKKSDLNLIYFAAPLGIGLFLINLNLNISRLISGIYLTDVETAVLASTLQLALAGAPLITGICQAFLPRFTKLILAGQYVTTKNIFFKILLLFILLGTIGCSLVYAFGKDILLIIYNAEIAQYANIFTLCMIGATFNYLSAMSNLILTALEKHSLQKNIMLVCVAVNIFIALFFVKDFGLSVLVIAFVSSSLLRLVISHFYTMRYLNKQILN